MSAARHHALQRQRHGRPAAPLPLAPQRHAHLLAPCRAMSDDDDEEWETDEQQQQAAPVPAPVQQAAADEAATAATATAEAAPAASARQQTRQAKRGVAAAPAVAEPDMGQAWKMGLGGVAALAAVAGLGFLGHRLFKSQAMTDAVSNVQQVGRRRVGQGGVGTTRMQPPSSAPLVALSERQPAQRCWALPWHVRRPACGAGPAAPWVHATQHMRGLEAAQLGVGEQRATPADRCCRAHCFT